MKSKCKCGVEYIIETHQHSARADNKIVYPASEKYIGWNSFRCRGCGECVDESVPGADFEKKPDGGE